MLKLVKASFFIGMACSLNAGAQNFDTLLNTVVSNNTELMSAYASSRSELLGLRRENNLPDPEVDLEYQWGRRDAGDKFDVSISQEFDWPGVYVVRGKANRLAGEAFSNLNHSNYIDKRLEIKLLMIDIVNVKKNLAVLKQRSGLMDGMIEKYSTGVHAGEMTVLDLRKLKIEKIKLNSSIESVQAEYAALKSSLESQNGGNECADIVETLNSYPDEYILPIESYITLLEENDPAARYNSLMVQAQNERLKAEKLMRFPGFALGYHHSWENGDVFNGLIVGLRLPVFSTRHSIKAARALRSALEYDEITLAARKRAEVGATREKALGLYRQMTDYEQAVKGDNTEELLKKALEGGQISLLNYLAEMDYYLQAELEMLSVQYEYYRALAVLNKYRAPLL